VTALAGVLVGASACGNDVPGTGDAAPAPDPLLAAPPIALAQSLATAAGATRYVVDTAATAGGRLLGTVRSDGDLPADTLVRPTHDTHACRPVPDAPLVGTRDGVGEAIAWLVGVARGPADPAPRRAALALEGCRIVPRLTRVPQGATLLVRSGDAMDSRLRFVEAGAPVAGVAVTRDSTVPAVTSAPAAPRALIPLGDAGAVVPVTAVTERPGLVEIRDDRHPWVRGWVAVAPHPFVTISDRDGRFAFDGVPPGRYELVTWHERLGTVATPVLVEAGVELRVTVTLPAVR
jgi:hypothetical protein